MAGVRAMSKESEWVDKLGREKRQRGRLGCVFLCRRHSIYKMQTENSESRNGRKRVKEYTQLRSLLHLDRKCSTGNLG